MFRFEEHYSITTFSDYRDWTGVFKSQNLINPLRSNSPTRRDAPHPPGPVLRFSFSSQFPLKKNGVRDVNSTTLQLGKRNFLDLEPSSTQNSREVLFLVFKNFESLDIRRRFPTCLIRTLLVLIILVRYKERKMI